MKIIIEDRIATHMVDFSKYDRVEDGELIVYEPTIKDMYDEFYYLMTTQYSESSIEEYLKCEYGK